MKTLSTASTTILTSFLAIMIVIAPLSVGASHCPENAIVCNPFDSEDFQQIFNRIIRILTIIALPVYAIMVGLAVYNLITGSAAPAKRQKAKKIFLYSTLGFFMLLLASGIVAIVGGLFYA